MTDAEVIAIIKARKKREQRKAAITELIAAAGVVSLPFIWYMLIYSVM